MCQDLSQTSLVSPCSGNFYATIVGVNSQCYLNATSVPLATTLNGNFAIQYTNTDATTNNGVTFLTVELICNSSATVPITGPLVGVAGTTGYTTTLATSLACPIFTYNAFIQFIDTYKAFWGAAFIILGVFLAFFGRYLLKVAVFIAGTILITFIILVVFYATFLSSSTDSWVGWLVVSLALIVGLVGGYFLQKYEKIDAALLGAWGGFTLGVLLNETVLYLASSTALFWIVNITLAIAFAIAGFFAFNQVIMIGTAFIGSYVTARGISLYAGGFPNEYVLINQIKNGAVDNINPVFYAYLAGIVIMSIIAYIVQLKMFKRMEQHEQHPYNKLN
jgi:Domain of unknown function (DUF4203)